MKGEQIFEKISELKEKFREFFQQRKQMSALENYSQIQRFTDTEEEVFSTIKYCMKGAFLEDEDADWISRKLNRLQINYLDWAHRTKWLKEQIAAAQIQKPKILQTFFEFAPKQSNVFVPMELLASKTPKRYSARI